MKFIRYILSSLILICMVGQVYSLNMPSHPRLLMQPGEEAILTQRLLQKTLWSELHKDILQECDKILVLPTLGRKQVGMRLLATSREALRRIFFLSYAYRMSGDRNYFVRAEAELLAVSHFQDWNPSHFLDVAEMTLGVAIGYDWLYHVLSMESREIISKAIIQKGLLPSLDDKYNWFLRAKHNWNQVCNAGITFGAIAVFEQDPVLCEKLIKRSIASIALPMSEYYPDGAYPEGYTYWKYGTTFNVLLLAALENIYHDDFGLTGSKGFMNTATYYAHMTGASGQSFNYADCGSEYGLTPAVLWFAGKTGNSSLLWVEKDFMQSKYKNNYLENRVLPAALIWGIQTDLEKILPPDELMWIGGGTTPVALMRTSWTDPNAIYVGFKGGTASSNHAHMDAGTFVMEADGVRWAIDFGSQDYESLESRKLQIWKNDQDSERWKVFRYNNYAHNTLTVNGKLHNVAGSAPFVSMKNEHGCMTATADLSAIFEGDLVSAVREAGIIDRKYVLIQDSVVAFPDKATTLRWTMLTRASIRDIAEKHLILEQDGKILYVEFESKVPIEIKTWSTQSANDYDASNQGTVLVGFESLISAGQEVVFKTVLRPGNLMNSFN